MKVNVVSDVEARLQLTSVDQTSAVSDTQVK